MKDLQLGLIAFLILCVVVFFKDDIYAFTTGTTVDKKLDDAVDAAADADAATVNADQAMADASDARIAATEARANAVTPEEKAEAKSLEKTADDLELDLEDAENVEETAIEKQDRLAQEARDAVTAALDAATTLGADKGFTYHQGKDTHGNNIRRMGTTIGRNSELLDACNADGACCGINSHGYLKHTIEPQSAWNHSLYPVDQPSNGMYVKNSCKTNATGQRVTSMQMHGSGLGPGAGDGFSMICDADADDYVKEIYGTSGNFLNSVGVRCQGGKDWSVRGGSTGTPYTMAGPFNTISGNAGAWVDNLGSHGSSSGKPWTRTCPAGQKIRAVHGVAGTAVGSLGFACA